MSVTIKDIAKACNISYSSVSRVLNGKTRRETAKTKLIKETAEALGYKPNVLAVNLVRKTSNMIGLIVPDIANPHYSEITKCVEDEALKFGYDLFLCSTDWNTDREVRYRDSLLNNRVAGMIVMPVRDESHALFRKLDIPVVLLGSRTEEPELNYAVMDNEKAGYLGAKHLIQNGYKNLCYIDRKIRNYTSSDRLRGFEKASQEYHIDSARIVTSDSFGMQGGIHIVEQMFIEENIPNGFLTFNDFLALGAMQGVEERALTIGKDIGIVGYDNVAFSSLHKIGLTSIAPSHEELARIAIRMIANEEQGKSVIVEPHLYERTSCII